ncbi:hypothetical protein GQ457_12G022410 [Hibiscus cannabinus]
MAADSPAYFTIIMLLSRLLASMGLSKDAGLQAVEPSHDPAYIASASQDFGLIVKAAPQGVLFAFSPQELASFIQSNYKSSAPLTVAARGLAHSVRGQASAKDGVVIDILSLGGNPNGTGISVSGDGTYVDVGAEQLWVDVLNVTLRSGVAPVSWTDYLYLTVGGTLSNAGISGQTFRFGPQISNVAELDVGVGDFVTCSPNENSDLFYAVLGGLGQFGIITRARIPLAPAPEGVKWIRLLYSDFAAFSKDQEFLISKNDMNDETALNYVEGSLLLSQASLDPFFSPEDQPRIVDLITKSGIVYSLEIVKHYDDQSKPTVDKDLEELLKGLGYLPDFRFEKDVTYFEFLNRVRAEEMFLRSKGLWEVPHPWLNLFVPKSGIAAFNDGVFKGIVLKKNITTGPLLVYPMNRNKWDDRMSACVPDEEIFYTVGLLHASGFDNWQSYDEQNKLVFQFCEEAGIEIKLYLLPYASKEEWSVHFGYKWDTFQQAKQQFDPKFLLSPGQKIFNDN